MMFADTETAARAMDDGLKSAKKTSYTLSSIENFAIVHTLPQEALNKHSNSI
jgi:hypothetical protein